ncbi:hypothetical protein Anas_02864 [Armadillidium nasatum]|uniref:Uncharacterized protein n=1 Tax=Armadillidium nasatum TaxID=96803 RepID=A0A5N5SLD3_9CRUS|nr:hypothetical protein Anas_02864 [Armadillidium nasatum]
MKPSYADVFGTVCPAFAVKKLDKDISKVRGFWIRKGSSVESLHVIDLPWKGGTFMVELLLLLMKKKTAGRNPNGASNSEEELEFPEGSERNPMLVASSGTMMLYISSG